MIIGSRGSALALWQARHIAGRLEALGVETRIEIIKTTGDKIQDVPLAKVGGKGLFVRELEQALAAGRYEPAAEWFREAGKLGLRDRRLGPLLSLALFKAGQQLLRPDGWAAPASSKNGQVSRNTVSAPVTGAV